MLVYSSSFIEFDGYGSDGLGSVTRHLACSSNRNGAQLFGLEEISDISAIARDIAFVLLCIVATITLLVILAVVRKASRRFQEAMDRIDDLIDSLAAARDAVAEFRDKIRARSNNDSGHGGSSFNVASWLLSPLGHAIRQQFRKRRTRDES